MGKFEAKVEEHESRRQLWAVILNLKQFVKVYLLGLLFLLFMFTVNMVWVLAFRFQLIYKFLCLLRELIKCLIMLSLNFIPLLIKSRSDIILNFLLILSRHKQP